MAEQIIACECGKKLRVDDRHAGKTVRCPGCRRTFPVPVPAAEDLPMVLPADSLDPEGGRSARTSRPVPGRQEEVIAGDDDVEPIEENRPRPRKRPRRRPQRSRGTGLRNFFDTLSYYLQGRNAGGFLVMGAMGGIVMLVFAVIEGRLMGAASETPQTMTLAQLAARGPGDNAHVIVTDCYLCDNIVYSERTTHGMRTGNWTAVFVPAVPQTDVQQGPGGEVQVPADRIRVIVHSTQVHGKAELPNFLRKTTIQGTVVNSIRSLDRETQNLLREGYPNAHFDSCYILQEGRKPSSAGFVLLMAFLGTLLLVVSGLLFVVRLMFRD